MDIYDPIGKALGLPPMQIDYDPSQYTSEPIPAWNKGFNHFGSKENHPWYGRKHTEESKNKISNSHKGIKASDETKRKMSESRKGTPSPKGMLGKKHSTETKLKMSVSSKGFSELARERQKEHMLGKKLSEETRAKMRQSALNRKNKTKHIDSIT